MAVHARGCKGYLTTGPGLLSELGKPVRGVFVGGNILCDSEARLVPGRMAGVGRPLPVTS